MKELVTEDMYRIAFLVLEYKIKSTLEVPNSAKGRSIAERIEKETEIPRGEVQRFQNAVINDNVQNSFKPERANQITWSLFKFALANHQKLPNLKTRGEISEFANKHSKPLNLVLKTFKFAYQEIIEVLLSPQKQF